MDNQEVACKGCGSITNRKSGYCNNKCRQVYDLSIHGVECKECGKIFRRYRIKDLFCSHECYSKNWMDNLPVKKCLICGKEFNTYNGYSEDCCSRECYKSHKKILKENRPKKSEVNAVRFWVFSRDDFKCIYCGKSSIDHGITLTLEHIFPRWAGGQNTWYNVVTSCYTCNSEKFGWLLPRKTILRIWDRNKKLGVKSPYKYVDEVIHEFEMEYPTQTIDLKQYFRIVKPSKKDQSEPY